MKTKSLHLLAVNLAVWHSMTLKLRKTKHHLLQVTLTLLVLFTLHSAHAVDAVWRADSGQYPDQMWPNWAAAVGGGVMTPVYLYFTNQYLFMDTSGGGDMNKVA